MNMKLKQKGESSDIAAWLPLLSSCLVWSWGHVCCQVCQWSQLVRSAQLTAALAFMVVQHSSCTISGTHAMIELLYGSSLRMVLVMSVSHGCLSQFIMSTCNLLWKEYLMEHDVRCVLQSTILGLLHSNLQSVRTAYSGDCHIQLSMGEHLGPQPDSHLLQCLT